MELYELGVKQAQEGLAKGEFSSVELTQAIIDRYHAKNGEIGAYLTFDEEDALRLAKEADEQRAQFANSPTRQFVNSPIAQSACDSPRTCRAPEPPHRSLRPT